LRLTGARSRRVCLPFRRAGWLPGRRFGSGVEGVPEVLADVCGQPVGAGVPGEPVVAVR
jgi:hypothetical protein